MKNAPHVDPGSLAVEAAVKFDFAEPDIPLHVDRDRHDSNPPRRPHLLAATAVAVGMRHPASPLPDAAGQALVQHEGMLDWVGMQGIRMPIQFDGGDGVIRHCNARVGAFVNLIRPDRRGIHMSRLYLLADRHLGASAIDAAMLETLLRAFLQSHEGLADRARIDIRFEHLVRRPALRSGHQGWRTYPVRIEAELADGNFRLCLGTEITYSSTCPASAMLARQAVQEHFAGAFDAAEPLDHAAVLAWLGSEGGIIATPHAQRSIAQLRVCFADGAPLNLMALLDRVEQALGTAVQAAVKREDEQAFALANGGNPMFCEDAARRIQRALDSDGLIAGFSARVEHQESLHAHDAVAYASSDPAERGCAAWPAPPRPT